jgi:hypothetical protein
MTFDLSSGNHELRAGDVLRPAGGRFLRQETFQNDAIIVGGKAFLSTFGAEFVHHKTTKIQ